MSPQSKASNVKRRRAYTHFRILAKRLGLSLDRRKMLDLLSDILARIDAPKDVVPFCSNRERRVLAGYAYLISPEGLAKIDNAVGNIPPSSAAIVVQAAPTKAQKDEFYASWEWRTLRMQIIKEQGRRCSCCGATPADKDMSGKPVKIVVDHIKPLSKFWDLRLDKDNLAVLCDECNQGKGNWDYTDWRCDPA